MWASESSLLRARAEDGIVGLWRCFVKGSLDDKWSCASLPSLAFTAATPLRPTSTSEQTALYRKTIVHQFATVSGDKHHHSLSQHGNHKWSVQPIVARETK